MKNIINKKQLWALSNEELSILKGRRVKLTLSNGDETIIIVKGFGCAANPPHLYVDLISSESTRISFDRIEQIEII